MTLKWKLANKTKTTNERKESDLIGLSNGYKRHGVLVGWVNARMKKLHARRTFYKSIDTSLWRHTATRLANRTMPSPYYGFLWRENEESMFSYFYPLADKTIRNTYRNYISRSYENRSITLWEEAPFVFFLNKEKTGKRNKVSADRVFTARSPKVWPLLIYSHSFVQI